MKLDSRTIFALSSGRVPAAIAVVRISGPAAAQALELLTGRLPEARKASLAIVRDPGSGETIDQALSLWFPGPASETGEDMAELQLHGGRAVVAATLDALGGLDGFRPAEAGEFTRRAFANGRIDLTAVEGLADLIGAETEAQRRQAVRQMRGALGKRAEGWRDRLIALQARVEAGLDFSDEGDVPEGLAHAVKQDAAALAREIGAALDDGRRGERLRDGLTIAIAGPPNVGKSSLFNWFAGRDAAIVSPHPGTTRDVIEVNLDLAGNPVTILDTAGVRASDDPVEQEGIRRAQARAAEADLVLWVADASRPADAGGCGPIPVETPVWRVSNKADLIDSEAERTILADNGPQSARQYVVSVATGRGLEDLQARLEVFAANALGGTDGALVTRVRHRQALQEAAEALNRLMNIDSADDDLLAEELRMAAAALGRLTGRIDVEDVLDAVFRDFCIGK